MIGLIALILIIVAVLAIAEPMAEAISDNGIIAGLVIIVIAVWFFVAVLKGIFSS
jgi:hypothetical protein